MNDRRPEPSEYHHFYARYMEKVPEIDVVGALELQIEETRALLASIPEERGGHRYAPGKWSIREIAGHLGDAERAFGYRLFAFSRNETQELPGFDEDPYVAASGYDQWPLAELIEQFVALRRSNLLLIRRLSDDAWDKRGVANGAEMSVRALAYGLVGHVRHHMGVLRERYL